MSEEETPEVVEEDAAPKFDELHDEGNPNENPDLNVIMDIPVTMSLEVGQTPISIRDLLRLNQGSVVELNRLAGDPLDVKVNGTLIAHGEVVVVNDKFGIRLTSILGPRERLDKIKDVQEA